MSVLSDPIRWLNVVDVSVVGRRPRAQSNFNGHLSLQGAQDRHVGVVPRERAHALQALRQCQGDALAFQEAEWGALFAEGAQRWGPRLLLILLFPGCCVLHGGSTALHGATACCIVKRVRLRGYICSSGRPSCFVCFFYVFWSEPLGWNHLENELECNRAK